MSQLHIVILIVKFIQGESQVRISMNQDYQLMTNSFLINSQDYQANSYFSYGIWSRYTPLGRNNQVGTIGILDSSCFHLHNAMGQSTKLLNFILFDCLEYPAQIIKRQILFKASDENWYSYEAIINNFMYEYTWHYFEITSWPFEKKLQLIFIQDKKTVLNKIIDVRIPYSDIDLQLTFGGGLLIDQYQDIPNLEKGTKFSFFPGKMELQPIYIGMYKKLSDYLLVTKLFTVECQCQFNSVRYANDKDLKFLESYSFTSQYPNCENFGLATWIRITNIKSDISEFTYNVMKLSATFSNSQLANENLAAFQLSYFLSPLRNKILISTYSYTFPLVNLDFSDNPFLIQREIDLYNDIKLWHYLAVGVINNEFTIFITFYEDFLEYYYEMYESVNHFHMVRYQLEYGNIKKQSNYFDVQFKNLNFDNCPFYIDYFNFCHFSCERCDGPTDTDCLSCSESSNRIYIREYKTCICPYDTIDDYQCRGFEQYKFSLNQIDANQSVECLFGYFEFEDQCTKCPSIIQDNFLTCLDCLFNPNTWSKILSCEINLYLNDEGQTSKIINQEKQYFISDGNEFKPCLKCKNYEDTNNSFEDSKQTIKEFQYFCLKNSIDLFVQNKDCFQCYIQDCKLCRITLFKQECIICWQGSKLINGECQMQVFILQPKINCVQPYYLDYQKNCKLCTIENCKYCFEYISNDLTKSTLYLNFNQFDMNEYHKIGCAQCEDNFIFDFQIGKCLQKQPSIENCLRSFINLQNIEVCTLSKYDNFSIAPAISNCLNYIQNCKQCILTPEKEIKCVLCNDGFTASIQTGQCYLCSILNSKTCIEGQAALKDGWVQQIQSFLMQFLNNYFYPTTKNFNKIAELPQECQNGFKPIFTIYCHQYCEPRCLSCIEHNQQFFCNQCPLNYYKQPIRSSEKGKCLQCSQLCLVCQSRTPEEINNINPSFKITDSNSFYTHKCLQKANDQNIVIDPYTNLAKYCYQTQCIDTITFKIDFDYNSFIEIFSKEFYNYYENLINIIYCNEFGIKELFIQVDFKKFNMRECNLIQRILIENNFKQKIFSLQKTHLQLIGTSDEQKQFISYLEIQNFDSVEINSAYFKIQEEFFISLTNDRNPIEFAIMNTIINSKQFNQFEYSLKLNNYKKLTIKNVTYDGLLIINQSLFDYLTLEFDSQILIENLIIQNSQFNYSNLFTFPNLKTTIKIDHLKINNCFFQNSAVFSFSSYLTANVDIIQMQVLNTYFVFSTLIYISGKVKITLSLSSFISNYIYSSNILFLDQTSEISQIQLESNQFINSKFIQIIQTQEIKSQIRMDLVLIQLNKFQDSMLFEIDFDHQENEIIFSNLQFLENEGTDLQTLSKSLFYINCQYFKLYNCTINQQFYLSYFQLFEVFNIDIQNVNYINSAQFYQVPLNQNCIQRFENNQLFLIQGFATLQMRLIKIQNQFTSDKSFIQILANVLQFYNVDLTIDIQDISFIGNIIEKLTLRDLISQMTIYAEKNLTIILKNVYFTENFLNQRIDDSSQNSAGLIFINSQKSVVYMENLTCFQNAITNSSTTFIYINSIQVKIFGFSIQNHNILQIETWKRYYYFNFEINLNEDLEHNFIKSIFQIQNKGGALQIITSNLLIKQGLFQDILSYSSVIDLIIQEVGIVKLENLNIQSIETTLNDESQGFIYIQSKNSLNFQLLNSNFQRVYNKLKSAILTIIPSLFKNMIKIQNVNFYNCISLVNQIIKIDFSYIQSDLYQIKLKNLTIIQNDQAWIQYFQKIQQINKFDIDKINKNNAAINLFGCNLIIDGLKIEGTFISSIIKISDSSKIIISNCDFYQIKTYSTFNILHFSQQETQKSSIYLQNIQFRNNKLISKWVYDDIIIKKIQYTFLDNQCNKKSIPSPFKIIESSLSIQEILNFLNQNIKLSGSLIYLQSILVENVVFQQIQIIQNNCEGCLLGLIYFQIVQFFKFKLTDMSLIQNSVGSYGCLYFNQVNQLNNQKIKLLNSLFLHNQGNTGTGIFLNQASIEILNCKFRQNNAIYFGGAIYMQNCTNDFKIIKSMIMENNAYQGGGIFFNGSNQLNAINFENSLVQQNNALLFANNLVEDPHHLSLLINGKEMGSVQNKLDNITSNILKIKSYKIVEQGQQQSTNILILPSNQIISNYKIFNPQNLNYIKFIYELQLNYKNTLNEKLLNFSDSFCTLDLTNQSLNNSLSNAQTIFYNQQIDGFDLGAQSISFDPYINNSQVFKLKINCCSKFYQKNLQYIITGKTFKCQLGEFYYNEGCSLCEPSQGFYSVTYNNTKCSIFDKTKFLNITSNQIQLLEGYWRPNHMSDQTEYCYKNQEFCEGGWKVGNDLCKFGHIGALCEECDIYNIKGEGKFFKITSDQICTECSDAVFDSLLPIFFAFIWSILQIILSLRSIDNSNRLFYSLKMRQSQRLSKILFKQSQDHQSILIKMFINYIWIFSLIFTFNIQFSIFFGFVDKASNISSFMANSLECQISEINNIQLIYSRIITMFIIVLILFLIINGGFLIHTLVHHKIINNSLISNTATYLYIANYAEFAKQYASLLSIRRISNIDFIQGNVSLEFFSNPHQQWIFLFIIPGFVIIGFLIPFLFFTFLFYHRKKLDQIKLRKHLCYMFNEYQDENYFWEFIKIWSKIIMIFILTYFETNIYLKGSLLGLSLQIYQALVLMNKPYNNWKFNNLDLKSAQICSITIFLSISKYASQQQGNKFWSTTLQFLIIFLFFRLCYLFILDILKAYHNIYKIDFLVLIQKMLKFCAPRSFLRKFIEGKLIQSNKKKQQLNQNFYFLKQYLFSQSKSKNIQKNININKSQNFRNRKFRSLRFTQSKLNLKGMKLNNIH